MKLGIVLANNQIPSNEIFSKVAEPCHNMLKGNRDYVENNIVLDANSRDTVCLYVYPSDALDRDILRSKVKEAVDIFFDAL